ncbi:M17 family metallopeptidase [Spiroplasma clarkii]|uniref:M17 family metallopeptidase n=1 Tax=Spiroplasma clarkii TaxID=2139 RepID=UPI0014730F2D|nr:M17 family metallopeptidase [Spiroplasma clarkii]
MDTEKTLYICLTEATTIRKIQTIIKKFVKQNKYDLNIDLDSFVEVFQNNIDLMQAVIETLMYQNHPVLSMKTTQKTEPSFNFLVSETWASLFSELALKTEFSNFARDLQNLPPNIATSIKLAELIEQKANEVGGIKTTILNKTEIQNLKMELLLAVNAGSKIEPRVVVLEYVGDPKAPKVALVGKGITFDSGGYNLKSSPYIKDMKFDMTGTAVVCGAVMALAKAKAKCNVVAIAVLTDNRIGETAMLPEAIYQSMKGLTVEITNTDAEGRLVLADGITYALQEQKAQKIITAATLTGAIRIALGRWFVGMFSNNDKFCEEFSTASQKAQEYCWRLPLLEEHLDVMKRSKIADLVNSEPGAEAGSSTAAAFLQAFVEDKPFIHVDLSGVGRLESEGTAPMLKTIFELLK